MLRTIMIQEKSCIKFQKKAKSKNVQIIFLVQEIIIQKFQKLIRRDIYFHNLNTTS